MQELYRAVQIAADEIAKIDALYGKLALRKAMAVNEDTDVGILVQVTNDLILIANQINRSTDLIDILREL